MEYMGQTQLTRQMLQNRMAADSLCQQLLLANNALGILSLCEDSIYSPPPWNYLHQQSISHHQTISNLKNQCFQIRQEQTKQLPNLSDDLVKDLQALNQSLLDADQKITKWLITQGVADNLEDAIQYGLSLYARFDIHPQFDPELSQNHHLHLGWQFPYVFCPSNALNDVDALGSDCYQLGRWGELVSQDRPELAMVTNSLLKEFICFVPELGFVARYATQLHLFYAQECLSIDLAIPSAKAFK
ncbi:hypothetical protein ICN48_10220 [Polynucleobacter sp. JS-Safj-400b-B2]|uniref:hypothetical protein n=1 Tax=Polynucleobacter sp. JS-Safj-400b-B2 TaxID=2576921 RepID=UPI001C0BA067|nr:hypothetical protein [Polynucleobacter sp. JS-Safj-400b-B2]MBU3626605.1 hypothetical protein [Polynucleobacter sp. JS-Safj-400b-B2]